MSEEVERFVPAVEARSEVPHIAAPSSRTRRKVAAEFNRTVRESGFRQYLKSIGDRPDEIRFIIENIVQRRRDWPANQDSTAEADTDSEDIFFPPKERDVSKFARKPRPRLRRELQRQVS